MNKYMIKAAVGAMALLAGAQALAYDFTSATLQSLGQSKFRLLGEDVSSTLSYKPMIPAADLGITGFDVGVSFGGTKIANRNTMKVAADGASVPSVLPSVALRVHKGLPFNLNVGASYTNVPGTPLSALGGELRWAVLPGGALMPAVSARVSAASSTGVDQLKMKKHGLRCLRLQRLHAVDPLLGYWPRPIQGVCAPNQLGDRKDWANQVLWWRECQPRLDESRHRRRPHWQGLDVQPETGRSLLSSRERHKDPQIGRASCSERV